MLANSPSNMKTHFYERTAYRLSEQPVPACFIKLDDLFDTLLPATADQVLSHSLVLAESICARMAEVEMYAFLIEDARKRHSLDRAEMDYDSDLKTAVLTRSFLVGYIGACRGLLDSVAVALTALYDLPLTGANCSFHNGDFWHQFVVEAPNTQRRYHPLRLFFNEVFLWSSEMSLRIVPVVLLQHHYGKFSRRETLLKVLDERDADIRAVTDDAIGHQWIDPIDLHTRWKPQFLILCEKICHDIGVVAENTRKIGAELRE
jgi:hypothetical protein